MVSAATSVNRRKDEASGIILLFIAHRRSAGYACDTLVGDFL